MANEEQILQKISLEGSNIVIFFTTNRVLIVKTGSNVLFYILSFGVLSSATTVLYPYPFLMLITVIVIFTILIIILRKNKKKNEEINNVNNITDSWLQDKNYTSILYSEIVSFDVFFHKFSIQTRYETHNFKSYLVAQQKFKHITVPRIAHKLELHHL